MAKKTTAKPKTLRKTATKGTSSQKLTALQRLTLHFFSRPRKTAVLLLVVFVLGIASYTTLLKREGFPNIKTPLALSQGAYLVNDAARVDKDVAKPLNDFLVKQDGVKTVQTQSFDNFYVATVLYEESVDAETKTPELQKQIKDQKILPEQATGALEPFKFGFTNRGDDMTIAFYNRDNSIGYQDLAKKAEEAARFLNDQSLELIQNVSIINPFETAANPATGETQTSQKSYERFGVREGKENKFYNAIVIGVDAKDGADNLVLDEQVRSAVDKLNNNPKFSAFKAEISASNAPSINQQIDELQTTLLEGLGVVFIVAAVLIAIRASFIIIAAMISVITIVLALLYAIGYSLNTITLFGLVLSLSLIVDDTIIMVEALDAQRRRRKDAREVVEVASRKVGRAMIAATSTAALSFAPIIFVGGILGSFIRAIPVTIISALIISLFVALIFIPLFARFLLLKKDKMGTSHAREGAAGFEAKIAEFIARPMLWAKGSTKKLFAVGIVALVIGFGFIFAGGAIMQKVKFNIFPPEKDSNFLSSIITYAPGTDIATAEKISDEANKIIADELGDNLVLATYFDKATPQSAMQYIEIKDYKDREVTAPQLIDQLNDKFKDFDKAKVEITPIAAGPPAPLFAIRVNSNDDRDKSLKLAADIKSYLESAELKRPNGKVAELKAVEISNPSVFTRENETPYVEVTTKFADDDTSALVTLAKDAVQKEFNEKKVKSYGLDKDSITFNAGQEDENQESFKTMAIAFPILLIVIYIVLAFQFKSMLQPLLIFMAIPFSFFGITLALYLSDNAFSFFAMLGFFALIGLSIKNTILLTDYANQARREGMHAVDAAHEALAERFRPLIATSLTAVVSLIPLALTSPFWEGLAFVLIGGMLSSTFLVITVFPYYYLGAEFLRTRISRKMGIIWIVTSILAIVGLSAVKAAAIAPLVPVLTALALIFGHKRVFKKA
jgi:multidrug efflux pump subunit AcrB